MRKIVHGTGRLMVAMAMLATTGAARPFLDGESGPGSRAEQIPGGH